MNGIFVLGPSEWLDPGRVSSRITERPRLVREDLAKMLGKCGVPGVMMEGHAARPKETHTGLFTRLVRENHVEASLPLLVRKRSITVSRAAEIAGKSYLLGRAQNLGISLKWL